MGYTCIFVSLWGILRCSTCTNPSPADQDFKFIATLSKANAGGQDPSSSCKPVLVLAYFVAAKLKITCSTKSLLPVGMEGHEEYLTSSICLRNYISIDIYFLSYKTPETVLQVV